MKIESNISNKIYHPSEVVRIVNLRQLLMYIKHHVYPIDLYTSLDDYDRDVLVGVFLKKDTEEVYEQWCNHKLR